MRRLSLNVAAAALTGLGVGFGVWLASELRDPYSDIRLRLSELADHLKGARS